MLSLALKKELKSLIKTPLDGIHVSIDEDDMSQIFADIEGPSGTPYEGGRVKLKLFARAKSCGVLISKI